MAKPVPEPCPRCGEVHVEIIDCRAIWGRQEQFRAEGSSPRIVLVAEITHYAAP